MSKTVPQFIADVKAINDQHGGTVGWASGGVVYDWFQAWCTAKGQNCVGKGTFMRNMLKSGEQRSRHFDGNWYKLLDHRTFGIDTSDRHSVMSDPWPHYLDDDAKLQRMQYLLGAVAEEPSHSDAQ